MRHLIEKGVKSKTEMKRRSRLPVQETAEELQELLKRAKNKEELEKVQAWYWFQSGQVKTVKGIAFALGKSRATIQRWWYKYATGGLDSLCNRSPAKPGRKRQISEEASQKLAENLSQEQGFES